MQRFRTIPAAALLYFWLSVPQSGSAATNVVSNLADDLSAGTLRATIANSLAGDTIVFGSNLSGTISLIRGQLLLNKNLTIRGPGAKVVTISGNNTTRVLSITNATVALSGLTIANGRVVGTNGASGSAGEAELAAGLLNWHGLAGFVVTVTDCAFVTNTAIGGNGGGSSFVGGQAGGYGYGGAVFNNSVLRMQNCCFIGNLVVGGNGGYGPMSGGKGGSGLGAGIWNLGTLALTNCTFAINTARGGDGGGAANGISFPGNGGNAEGVGLYNGGQATVISCTVVSNTAAGGAAGSGGGVPSRGGNYGGGLRASAGTLTLANTIVACNSASEAADVSGSFTSQGFNLVGGTNGSSGLGALQDLVSTTNNPINPRLGPLQDNGGPTMTMALLTNSPAIDQGSRLPGATDQRGASRPFNFLSIPNAADGSDIGAYELIGPALDLSNSPGGIVLSWSTFTPGYALQSSPDLEENHWILATDAVVVITGTRCCVTNPAPIGNRFFRLYAP